MEDDIEIRTNPATSDFGVLVLRVGAGAAVIQAGALKAVDFGTVADYMSQGGWSPAMVAAIMVTATELLGGLALVLGILTPLAACGVTAAMLCAWAANVAGDAFWANPFNVPFLLAIAAIAVLFTGAGRFSLDQLLWLRAQWPTVIPVALLILAIGAAVATWWLLNGGNPLHLTKPTA
ncbi:DoxX family protein [Mycobacterium sp. MS1601]|uniref:DoxX family protein n=1 Tax=Mycobacterium sp. MS1601 TaxID=1936029 RepID=UPI0009793A29|nr:DoxX family protein [Mycobacterium sp. MS1601]AQA04033.1 DoxX family protein [Mycobacterium sp. MS1601]